MSKKERETRDKRRNAGIISGVALAIIFSLIGLLCIGTFGVTRILGYEIDISKPDPMNAPKSTLLNSPNNRYHILTHVDSPNEFWEAVENIETDQNIEVCHYTATPYQRGDGTWGTIYVLSYETH